MTIPFAFLHLCWMAQSALEQNVMDRSDGLRANVVEVFFSGAEFAWIPCHNYLTAVDQLYYAV